MAGQESQGATFAVGAGSPVSYANTVLGVTGIGGPEGQATVIDVSDFDSTAKEKLMGLADEGQISLDLNFIAGDTTGQGALQAAKSSRAIQNLQVKINDAADTTLTFQGFVLSYNLGLAVDDKISAAATIEISGAVVWT